MIKLGHAPKLEELRIGRKNNGVATRGASLAHVARLLSGNQDFTPTQKEIIEKKFVVVQSTTQSLQQTKPAEHQKLPLSRPKPNHHSNKLQFIKRILWQRVP